MDRTNEVKMKSHARGNYGSRSPTKKQTFTSHLPLGGGRSGLEMK